MKIQRRISPLAALAVLAAGLCASGTAQAGSLLSGYGGPGQGNQAILGSTLVGGSSGGGPSGGAGGGGSGSGGGSGGEATSQTGAPATLAAGPETPASGAGGGARPVLASHARGHAPSALSRAPRAAVPAVPLAAAGAKEGSQPLGLSGDDLLYVLVALGLLVLTAALTLHLARPGPMVASTKGIGRGTRVTE